MGTPIVTPPAAPKSAPTRINRTAALIFAVLFLAALAVRLIGITQPFVDTFSWRQADVAMIAQNFFQNGYDILHPHINWSPDTTGIVGTEFPLLPFLAALLYNIFGIHEWIGRAIPVLFFLLSLPYFFRLIARLVDVETALLALAFYAFTPLAIITSRTFLPDPLALGLSVAGLYYFVIWLDSMRPSHLVLSACLISTAVLVKAPYVMTLAPVAYLSVKRFGWDAVRSKALWFLAVVALVPSMVWYAHALRIPTATTVIGGPPHVFGQNWLGFVTLSDLSYMLRWNWWPYLTPVIIIPALAGLFLFPKAHGYRTMFYCWLAAMAVFILVDGPGNREHRWYQLPMLPVAAALAAGAVDHLLRRAPSSGTVAKLATLAPFIVAAVLIGVSYFGLQPKYEAWNPSCMEAAKILDHVAPAGALALITDEGDPSCLYYTRRKGWHFWNPKDDSGAIDSLERYRSLGAGYLILDADHLWWLDHYKEFAAYLAAKYPRSVESDHFAIFDLKRPTP